MKTYLFLFTIGPVQSFIAQARKTQDLYAGSKILSDLCRVGIQLMKSQYNVDLIFPYRIEAESLPNRFLVKIKTNLEIKVIGLHIQDEVEKYWIEDICKPVMRYKSEVSGLEEQLKNHLDIHWVFKEIKDGESYKEAYTKIESLLGAVKNSRQYGQYTYQTNLGEKGRKCSLDGERNIKFYKPNKGERLRSIEKNGVTILNKLYVPNNEVYVDKTGSFSMAELQGGEGLSAVSMVKRKYKEVGNNVSFDSTAEIALYDSLKKGYLIEKVKSSFFTFFEHFTGGKIEICRNAGDFDAFINCIKKIEKSFNWQLIYEEGIKTTNSIEKLMGELPSGLNPHKIKHDQRILTKVLEDENLALTKYYAIIDFDGDQMGKWLGGDQNFLNQTSSLESFHRLLSEKLSLFGNKAEKIINQFGQTVYSGGDDFIGFVNLNYLFDGLAELRSEFKKVVNDPLSSYLKQGNEISFSAGICIAHYKEPLRMVLSKASVAQKSAKHEDKGNRNAFSIVASKHSGENHETYYKWGTEAQNFKDINNVITELNAKEGFSNTFIKSLNVEFGKLMDENKKLIVDEEILLLELKRLLSRSCLLKKKVAESKKDFQIRRNKKVSSVTKIVFSLFKNSKPSGNLDNFLSALNICDFIQRIVNVIPKESQVSEII